MFSFKSCLQQWSVVNLEIASRNDCLLLLVACCKAGALKTYKYRTLFY